MKDKRAAALKKRRREERTRQLEESKDKFMEVFNQHLSSNGSNKIFDRELVWKAQKSLRKKIQKKACRRK